MILLAATGVLLLGPLSFLWQADSDYAYGWSVPFLAAYLFYERWKSQPALSPPTVSYRLMVACLILWSTAVLAVRLILEVVPDWRPALWMTALLYLAAMLGWCELRGGRAWVRHFCFPVAFVLLSVPWPYQLETPVVQGLMRTNAILVSDAMVLVDIPARAAGNTLLLATGQLGIEQACSGLRSLEATLMMSFFLGEFYRLRVARRALLPAAGVLLALAGNFARLLFLAWKAAHDGLAAVERVHDSAGAEILIFTVLSLWGICLLFRTGKGVTHLPIYAPAALASPNRLALNGATGLLLSCLFSEIFTAGWFAASNSKGPDLSTWTLQWPQGLEHFHAIDLPASTHALLQNDEEKTGGWEDRADRHWQAFWFSYPRATVNHLAVTLHNPEVCLASAGLVKADDYGEFIWRARGLALPCHAYLFTAPGVREFVFWIAQTDGLSSGDVSSRPIIYGSTPAAFFGRITLWWREVLEHRRGASARTLEVAITGPLGEAEARAAFVSFLKEAIVPNSFSPRIAKTP